MFWSITINISLPYLQDGQLLCGSNLFPSVPPNYWLHDKISNKMHGRSRNKRTGWKREVLLCKEVQEEKWVCNRRKRNRGKLKNKKNQEPRHRQMISLCYCSEAQLGENGLCGHRSFMVKGVSAIKMSASGLKPLVQCGFTGCIITWATLRAVYMGDTLGLSVFC